MGGLVDAPIGELDAGDEPVLVVHERPVFPVGPGDFAVAGGVDVEVGQSLDGDLAGHFPRGVAAHAVGHDVQILFGEQKIVIFVVRAPHAHVGAASVTDLQGARRARAGRICLLVFVGAQGTCSGRVVAKKLPWPYLRGKAARTGRKKQSTGQSVDSPTTPRRDYPGLLSFMEPDATNCGFGARWGGTTHRCRTVG